MDMMDMDESFGQFDYIIAHGVYSWIPPQVQVKLMQICKQNLSPNGLAMISFNVLPGWGQRKMVRDMMMFHSRQELEPMERVGKSREMLDFLKSDCSSDHEKKYKEYLDETVESIQEFSKNKGDLQYWYHEYLDDFLTPEWLTDVAARAEKVGLQYLGETEMAKMFRPNSFSDSVTEFIQKNARNVVEQEQYVDFITNRMFRRSIFCHQGLIPVSEPGDAQLENLFVCANMVPTEKKVEITDESVIHFEALKTFKTELSDPLEKAALMVLYDQFPRFVSYCEVIQKAVELAGLPVPVDPETERERREKVTKLLFNLYTLSSSMVDFCTWLPNCVYQVSDHPKASTSARLQASIGRTVTNLRHVTLDMDDWNRYLLWSLDGNRSLREVKDMVIAAVKAGKLPPFQKRSPEDFESYRRDVETELDERITGLSQVELLVA
jgi:methyltransferase-like protein